MEKGLEEKRKIMVETARMLFGQYGIEHTSMSRIAKEANTSIGNLYFYFKNKSELVSAVIDDICDNMFAKVDAFVKGYPPGVIQLVRSFYAFEIYVYLNKDIAKVILQGSVRQNYSQSMLEGIRIKIQTFIAINTAELGAVDSYKASILCFGGAVAMIEKLLEDDSKANWIETFIFDIQWTMRALGFSQEAIDEAMDHIKTIAEIDGINIYEI